MDIEQVVTKLLSILELGVSSTGETLYKLINDEILNVSEQMKLNLLAIATDGGSNMNSSKKEEINGLGVVNRLTKDNPTLIFISDLCHLMNLVVDEALQQFPAYILQFVKKTCSYFRAGQRSVKLREIQVIAGIKEPLEVLDYVSIRWESLVQCVERVLKLWPYLKLCLEDTDSILKQDFADPEYELYCYILFVFLHKLTGYIIFYQKPSLLFDQVAEKMREGYILFSRMLLKKKFQEVEFEEMWSIPFADLDHIICKERLLDDKEFSILLNERYPKIIELLEPVKKSSSKSQSIEAQFYNNARKIIFQTVIAMKKRLPYDNTIINNSLAVYLKQVYSIDIWRNLAKILPNIINQDSEILLLDELDSFSLRYKTIVQEHKNSSTPILKRWNILKSDFPTIFKLARALLSIPYSTSPVESMFSEFKVFKTPYRNRLSIQNLEASILIEQHFKSDNPRILSEMIPKYFEIWKKKEVKSIENFKDKTESNEPEITTVQNTEDSSKLDEKAPNNLISLFNSFLSMLKTNVEKSDSTLLTSISDSKKRKENETLQPEDQKRIKLSQDDSAKKKEDEKKIDIKLGISPKNEES